MFEQRFNPQVKLAAQPQFSEFVAGHKIYPINVEVSPCQVCSAHCGWCFYSGTHMKMGPESLLDFQVGKRLLFDMVAMKVKAVSWTGGGEPTLHPQFKELTQVANSLKLQQGLFTNALLPIKYDPSLFDWIRVSNTDRDWNVEVIKSIRQKVKVLGMALNYVGDDNAVDRSLEVGDAAEVDYVQVRQALNLRGLVTNRKPPTNMHPKLFITDYKFSDSKNPHGYTNCYSFNFTPFVWHNGDVDVCGYHPGQGAPYTLGNLLEKSFKEIMDRAARSVPVCESCQVCCRGHEANKLVNAALELKDPNFV